MIGLIGKKEGMTCIFDKNGNFIPVTVLFFKKNKIVQIKCLEKDGYFAIQLSSGKKKKSRIKKSELGHFKNSKTEVGCILKEFRFQKKEDIKNFELGQSIDVGIFSNVKKINVTGISKGKGFSGTVKRWNFRTKDFTHGNSLSYRVPGSIGQNQSPGRVFKGKKMSGQFGNTRTTVKNLKVVCVDKDHSFILVRGSVPGYYGNYIVAVTQENKS